MSSPLLLSVQYRRRWRPRMRRRSVSVNELNLVS
jgi:hypothetical protein